MGSAASTSARDGIPAPRKLGGREVRHRLVAALDAGQRVVVEQDRDAVAAQPDVELDAVDPVRARGEDQRLERVLRREAPVPAVGEPEHRGGGRGAHPIRTVAAIPRWSDGYSVGSPGAGRSKARRADSAAAAPRSQT